MAQQPPNTVEIVPSNYRELYSTVGYQAGEPADEPARLVASYQFAEGGGGGERPTPAGLKEQTFALSDRRPMTFLCLIRRPNTSVEVVQILHRMMRDVELPGEGGGGIADMSMGLLGDIRAAQMPIVEVDNTHFVHQSPESSGDHARHAGGGRATGQLPGSICCGCTEHRTG